MVVAFCPEQHRDQEEREQAATDGEHRKVGEGDEHLDSALGPGLVGGYGGTITSSAPEMRLKFQPKPSSKRARINSARVL